MTTLYKALDTDRRTCHHTGFQWPEPGEWLEITGELVPCENALHLCRAQDILQWIAPELWIAETSDPEDEWVIHCDSKVCVRRARLIERVETWNERTLRLFACDCVERVLPLFEAERPGDDRPRRAIKTARRYAVGEATDKELNASRAAADAASRAAAWDAAWDASLAAAAAASRDAAWDASRDASLAASRAAAWDAAWDAALAASRAAAWDAAWDAARAASRAAAWDAAWDAAREWQTARLLQYLEGRA